MLKIVVTTFSQPHTMNRNVASNNLSKGLHFALLRFVLKRLRLKVVIIRVIIQVRCHILRQKWLHFAPMLHFALVVKFCGVTSIVPKVKMKMKKKRCLDLHSAALKISGRRYTSHSLANKVNK